MTSDERLAEMTGILFTLVETNEFQEGNDGLDYLSVPERVLARLSELANGHRYKKLQFKAHDDPR